MVLFALLYDKGSRGNGRRHAELVSSPSSYDEMPTLLLNSDAYFFSSKTVGDLEPNIEFGEKFILKFPNGQIMKQAYSNHFQIDWHLNKNLGIVVSRQSWIGL